MSIFDGIMLAVLVIGVIQGRLRGMAWQLAPIASLILGYVVARPLAPQVQLWFGEKSHINYLLAFVCLYAAVSLSVYLLARSVKDYIIKFKLEEYDRHLGAFFGGIKACLFVLVLVFFSVAMSKSARQFLMTTRTGYAAAYIMDALHPVMPDELHDSLEEYIHALDQPGMDLQHRHTHEHEEGHHHNESAQLVDQGQDANSAESSNSYHDHEHGHYVEQSSATSPNSDDEVGPRPLPGTEERELTEEEQILRGVHNVLESLRTR